MVSFILTTSLMHKNRYTLFIFDFDGTLADTTECIVASYQHAFTKNNLPIPSREEIIYLMGIELREVFQRLTSHALEESHYDSLVADYRAIYSKLLSSKTSLYPHVKETLIQLKETGGLLAIATSKKTDVVTMNAKALGVDQYFDRTVGADKVVKKKPHPEMLLYILEKMRIKKEDAVMIGDSTVDIDMGNAIEMDTIAVTWGAHTKEMLAASHPTYTIDSFSALQRFI